MERKREKGRKKREKGRREERRKKEERKVSDKLSGGASLSAVKEAKYLSPLSLPRAEKGPRKRGQTLSVMS